MARWRPSARIRSHDLIENMHRLDYLASDKSRSLRSSGRRSPRTARCPTLREIAEQTELGSIDSVHYHLRRLEETGVIVREPWQPRSIRLAR
ncbi:LexA family protein [Streptomyces chiangmaiensis]|uniref:LexA family protein n=1 Tax=Streptomyces chiangmaiensis TaxID=766497 RepID=UPI00363B32CD